MHLNYQQFTVAFAIPPRACKKPGPDTTRHTPGLEGRKKKKEKMLKYKILNLYSCFQNTSTPWDLHEGLNTDNAVRNHLTLSTQLKKKKIMWTCELLLHATHSCNVCVCYTHRFIMFHFLISQLHVSFTTSAPPFSIDVDLVRPPFFQFSQLHFSTRRQWRKLAKREVHLTQCNLIYNSIIV